VSSQPKKHYAYFLLRSQVVSPGGLACSGPLKRRRVSPVMTSPGVRVPPAWYLTPSAFLKWYKTGLVGWGDEVMRYEPWQNLYAILGVAPDASVEEAYKREALRWHPDRHSVASQEQQHTVAERFKAVSEAYQILSDPVARNEYDASKASKEPTKMTTEMAFEVFLHFWLQSFIEQHRTAESRVGDITSVLAPALLGVMTGPAATRVGMLLVLMIQYREDAGRILAQMTIEDKSMLFHALRVIVEKDVGEF
jgi:DnaJ-domain-containing protein 1